MSKLNSLNVLLLIFLVFISTTVSAKCTGLQDADTIKFELKYGRPFVETYVNDSGPYLFAVDIGASGIGRINKPLFDELQLPVIGATTNSDGVNTSEEQTVGVDELKVGSNVASDLELMMRDYGVPISGILARDFFNKKLLTIDYSSQVIIMEDGNIDVNGQGVMKYERAFRVQGKIGGADAEFNFDTGSNIGLVVPKAFLDENDISFRETGEVKEGRRSYTQIKLIGAELDETVYLGGKEFKNMKFFYSETAPGLVIGGPLLFESGLVIDQKNGFIKFLK